MLPPSFYDGLENWLNLAVYDINQEDREMSVYELKQALLGVPGAENLTMSYDDKGSQIINIDGKSIEVGSQENILTALQVPRTEIAKPSMTSISRLKEKLSKAAGVAHRAVAAIEAEADSLIAQEDTINKKTADSFAPHKAILAEANTELQAITDALNLMSNGGPPLEDAEPTAPASNAEAAK